MELFRALAVLAEPPERPEVARLAELLDLGEPPSASEYTETFVFQLYPYASVYLGAEGMLGGEARDRVAGFLSALGLAPPHEPDHLSTLLATYAQLSAPDWDDEGETDEDESRADEVERGACEDERAARRRAGRSAARKAFFGKMAVVADVDADTREAQILQRRGAQGLSVGAHFELAARVPR